MLHRQRSETCASHKIKHKACLFRIKWTMQTFPSGSELMSCFPIQFNNNYWCAHHLALSKMLLWTSFCFIASWKQLNVNICSFFLFSLYVFWFWTWNIYRNDKSSLSRPNIFLKFFFFIPSFFLLNNKFSSARNYCMPKRKLAIVLT